MQRKAALVVLTILASCNKTTKHEEPDRPASSSSAAASSSTASAAPAVKAAAADAGPVTSEFLAFGGAIGKSDRFRVVLERRGTELTGSFARDASNGSDVSLTGTMTDATHFTLTEVVEAGQKASTLSGTIAAGKIDATWKDPKGTSLPVTGGVLDPFSDAEKTFTQAYLGTLGPKIRIRMKLAKKADGTLSGVYRYTRSKEDLVLDGKVDEAGRFDMMEKSPKDKKVTGRFQGVFVSPRAVVARWSSPDGTKSFAVAMSDAGDYPEVLALEGGARLVPQEDFREPVKNCSSTSLTPQFAGLAKTDAEQALNKALRDVTASLSTTMTKGACDGATAETPFTTETDYEVTAKRGAGRFVALRVGTYAFTGGAHPNHGFRCFVADTQDGKLLRLASLLTPDGKKKLEDMTNKSLEKEFQVTKLTEAGFFEDHVPLGADPDLCLDATGFEVSFHSYEVAPYAMGDPSAPFTNAEVKPLFTPGDVTDALFK